MKVYELDHKGAFRINGVNYEKRIYIPERIKDKEIAYYALNGNTMVVRTVSFL